MAAVAAAVSALVASVPREPVVPVQARLLVPAQRPRQADLPAPAQLPLVLVVPAPGLAPLVVVRAAVGEPLLSRQSRSFSVAMARSSP